MHLDPQEKKEKEEGARAYPAVILSYILLVALVVGLPYYFKKVAPWRQVVLRVGDTSVTTREVIQRLRLQPASMGAARLETITALLQDMEKEALIRQEARRQNLEISDKELEEEIRKRVTASAPAEGKFEELYGALLRKMKLSEKEFREWVRKDGYRRKLLGSFYRKTPPQGEQVRLSVIVSGTAEQAETVYNRLRKGQDFSRLARETSIDLATARKGGDFGWLPKGVDELTSPGQVRASGILTRTRAEAEKIREWLLTGREMAELARRYSLDRKSREAGGDMGWISADGRDGRTLGVEAYRLNPGEVSAPLPSPEGFWIVQVREKTPRGKVIDDIAFRLPVGSFTPPLNTDQGFYILKVVEKGGRPLTAEQRALLAEKAMTSWLESAAEKGRKEGWIRWNWGSETYDWLVRQLPKE